MRIKETQEANSEFVWVHFESCDEVYGMITHGSTNNDDYGAVSVSLPKRVAINLAAKILELCKAEVPQCVKS